MQRRKLWTRQRLNLLELNVQWTNCDPPPPPPRLLLRVRSRSSSLFWCFSWNAVVYSRWSCSCVVIPSLRRLSEHDPPIPCALTRHSYVWTMQVSGLLQNQQCTYYDDCAITSVSSSLFCKSENLEWQRCNKSLHFLTSLPRVDQFVVLWQRYCPC